MKVKTNKVISGFTIEKGIEVPPNSAGGIGGRWARICETMEAGDSVLVATVSNRTSLAQRINERGYHAGYKAVTRKEGDKFRVWKLATDEEQAEQTLTGIYALDSETGEEND